MRRLRFDRGTLDLGDAEGLPTGVWDSRSDSHRTAALHFAEIAAHADAAGITLERDLRTEWERRPRDVSSLELRHYQAQALACWNAAGRRGVVVLPTGGGKTRVAVAAMFETGLPTAVLCPTRVLANAWLTELESRFAGERIGIVGDGRRRIERTTVLTFESAFRHMDVLGDRFGLLVVDEVHHFAGGARVEALESSAAVARLGLTATAPDPTSDGEARLRSLVGPVVYEIGYADLVGTHLAPVTVVRIPVRLDADERAEYDARTRAFSEMRRTFVRLYPGADIATLLRGLARSPEGLRALRDRARAVAIASFPRAKRALVRTLLKRHAADRTIVFMALAENAYTAARDNLIPVITGETAAPERREVLQAFREGKLRAIASARVLNEGVDVPDARVAILVAGALGAREYVQRIGRVLRPAPDKHAVVYELITTDTTDARQSRLRAKHAPPPSPRG
ncbi:MAG: DEAD/DEAH box helicase family protein [Labilithrix sp.]|nr:DEAD/DEAH box helicase family protein [Labilithrix sp.]MCW5815791.1 DEAD/DEAH box helicase family protein [Labilithrix sp.]